MADPIEAAARAYHKVNPFLTASDHDDALKAALAAADAARLKGASKDVKALTQMADVLRNDDEVAGKLPRGFQVWFIEKAAALITAQAARIEALEQMLATERVAQVRGSNDAPGFEACVNAEIESIRAALEGK